MARVRQKGTIPELRVRSIAKSLKLRFTTNNNDLPGSPDLANRTRKIAIFVHGCYWHRHPNCKRATVPKSNIMFWHAKFTKNVERDLKSIETLQSMNFKTIIVWECETIDATLIKENILSALS